MITAREVDPFDDDLFGRWYAAFRAGAGYERPDALLVTREALTYSLRNPGEAKRRIPVGAFDGDRLVGAMLFEYRLLDNLDSVEVEIDVPPADRRRGAGTVLWRWASARARSLGRTVIQTEQGVPSEPWPGAVFAAGLGFTVEHVEDHLVVPLPYDEARLERLRSSVGELDGYRLTSWAGPCPEEHLQEYADLHTAMDQDVPTGGMTWNPAPWTVDRMRTNEERMAASYLTLVTMAHTLDGTPAGYTQLHLMPSDPDNAMQSDTLVLRDHRGHRLGVHLKLANLDQLAKHRSTQVRLHTWTAKSIAAMRRINDQFGFVPVEENRELELTVANLRPAARGVVLDAENRLLLMHFRFDDGNEVWATPGGGVEPGESLHDALTRELREEIGLEPPADPPHLWHQQVVAQGHATGYDGVINDYFLIRVDSHQAAGTMSAEELAEENVHGHRWWTQEELHTHQGPATFAPRALPTLIHHLLTEGPPETPHLLGL
ncbi:NUDIX domain-containing protein [Kribbella amoyensis]|uniref:NUDIX domain-containing protein n=1 Tax=Kribbella amoyensis TaxID=996641 RepID=UPI0011A8F07C|nr:NUDIX domain-containing protein [Kribbella amoyensis]